MFFEMLGVSRQAEVGSKSWRHKWCVWTSLMLVLVWLKYLWTKKGIAIRSVLRMDNRRDNRPLREAMEEQYIGWIIGLEKVTSVFRLIQTVLVLLEWLLPLLEDVRLNANQRDIMAMFRDHLRELETEMQRQICEMREHILGRYHRTLQGWNTFDPLLCDRFGRYRR